MIILDNLEQGSEEWLMARSGIPTASNFKKIISSTGKASTSAKGYMNELLAEFVAGKTYAMEPTEWMQRGTELEEEARTAYSFITDNEVQEVGLIYQDESRLVSCSPDGLIGEDGGLEIKCPKHSTHVGYLLGGEVPAEHFVQVQGCLYVTGRKWWDFMSYHPDFDPLIVRVERDEKFMGSLSVELARFVDKMLTYREQLTTKAA